MDSPNLNKRRCTSVDYDLRVVTKEGKHHDCYKVNVCTHSKIIDELLSPSGSETPSSSSSTIQLDITSEEWKLLHSFIVPENPMQPPQLDCSNVSILLPIFHKYQVTCLIEECDKYIVKLVGECSGDNKSVNKNSIEAQFWASSAAEDAEHNNNRKVTFNIIISSFRQSAKYHLGSSLPIAAGAVTGLLSHLEHTGDLFDKDSMYAIVEALNAPLFVIRNTDNNVDDDGDDTDVVVDPRETARAIIKRHIPDEYSLNAIEEVHMEMFAAMASAYIQKEAAEKKRWMCQFNASAVIKASVEMFPHQLAAKVLEVTTDQSITTAVREKLVELYTEHRTSVRKEEYDILGINFPEVDTTTALVRDALLCIVKKNGTTTKVDALKYITNDVNDVVEGDLEDDRRRSCIMDAFTWARDNNYISYGSGPDIRWVY